MKKQLLKDTWGWGILLWFTGYVLGIILFMFVPSNILGWVIIPIGVLVTLWVLQKKIKTNNYLVISVTWTLIAIICDYLFLVRVFKPADGYYKLDVYIYYALTFMLPIIVSWKKSHENQ